MWGQWFGQTDETPPTQVMVNIDRVTPGRGRLLCINPSTPTRLVARLQLDSPESGTRGNFTVDTVNPVPEGWKWPATGSLQVTRNAGDRVDLSWKTSWETKGAASLLQQRFDAALPSDSRFDAWSEFKKWVLDRFPRRGGYIFRGQSNASWQLRTTFHRGDRFDLHRYATEDVFHLQRAVTGTIQRFFDLQNPLQHGALLHLAQHHGFPTPLLDWTSSPYIAAFFAFIEISQKQDSDVRIYVLDKEAWLARHQNVIELTAPEPYFNINLFAPLANPRALPQQSIATSTNLALPEVWIRMLQANTGVHFLTTVDMPASLRDEVIDELGYMGISAASLLPGLDGACRALREQLFRV